jgi:hypothetical protein
MSTTKQTFTGLGMKLMEEFALSMWEALGCWILSPPKQIQIPPLPLDTYQQVQPYLECI